MPVLCKNHNSEQDFTTKHFQTKYPISIHCALAGMSFGFSHSIASKKSYTSKRKVHCPLMSWFFQSTDITGNFFFLNFSKNIFSGFSLLGQETLDMGVFIYLMGSPDCEDLKKYMWEGYFRGTWNWGFWGVDDIQKDWNGKDLSMIEWGSNPQIISGQK